MKQQHKSMNSPKYPRIVVSTERHADILREAQSRNISFEQVAEERFAMADKLKKKSKKK